MSCASTKQVLVRMGGGIFTASCEQQSASSTISREWAAKVAAAKAWSKFFGKDILEGQIELEEIGSNVFEARCFQRQSKPFRDWTTKNCPHTSERTVRHHLARPPVNYLSFEEFKKLPANAKPTAHKQSPDVLRVKHGLVASTPLRCPFCGDHAKVKLNKPCPPELEKPWWSAACADRRRLCTAKPMTFGDTREGAIISWNTRANGGAS